MKAYQHRTFVVASPILIIIVGNFAAQFFVSLLDQWAWIGVFLVYWGSMLLTIKLCGGFQNLQKWFSKPLGSRWWLVLAIFVGLLAFPILLVPHISIMKSVPLVIAWFVFAVINSICEEIYWRGFLLDETNDFPRSLSVGYSSLLFIAVHPIVLGVFSQSKHLNPSQPLALLPFIGILVMLSVVWCLLIVRLEACAGLFFHIS